MNKKQLNNYIKVQAEFVVAETIILYAYKCLQKHPQDFFIYFQPILNCKNTFINENWKDPMTLDIFDECMHDLAQDMMTGKFAIHDTNGIFKCLSYKIKVQKSATLEDILNFFKEVLKSDGI